MSLILFPENSIESYLETAQYFWLKSFLDTALWGCHPLAIPFSTVAVSKVFSRQPSSSIYLKEVIFLITHFLLILHDSA